MGKYRPPVEEPKPQVEETGLISGVKILGITEETVDAVVDDCECLNIRKEPALKANNQIAILGKGTKIVVVDPKKPEKNKDGEWYKIRIFNADKYKSEGFAMKKYIKII